MLAIIVQYLYLTDKQMKDRRTIIESTQNYMDGYMNETVEHRNFNWWAQQPGESFDAFLITIRELIQPSKYCPDTCI